MKKVLKTLMIIAFAFTVFFVCNGNERVEAASAAGGYSVPASMTIKVGESKTLAVTEPSGKYANVSFGYTPNYVKTSGYSAGSYWGKKAQITFTGIAEGSFDAYANVRVFRCQGDPGTSQDEYRLYTRVTVVPAATSSSSQTHPSTPSNTSQPTKIPVQKIALDKSSLSLTVGDATVLSVKYTPSNATEIWGTTWSSSNSSVATINNGIVVAKKAGTATVTAKSGGKTATCSVTVKAKPVDNGSYKNVKDAYTYLNKFRTSKKNQWYWKSNNKSKTYVYGLKKLKKNATLEKVAKTRAKEAWTMYYSRGKATHTRPNGKSCWTAYPKNPKACGENLAWGQTTCKQVVLDGTWGWAETNHKYAGQGHRRNMLSKKAKKVGIACFTKNGQTAWAMCLGY